MRHQIILQNTHTYSGIHRIIFSIYMDNTKISLCLCSSNPTTYSIPLRTCIMKWLVVLILTFFYRLPVHNTQHKPFHLLLSAESGRMRSSSETQPLAPEHPHKLMCIDSCLRLSVIPLTAAAIWLTVTNNQDNSIYGKLEFSNLIGLKYMICINAISAAYALAALVSSCLRCLTKAWVFFVSDQVVAYLMVTSWAAVVEIFYLAYNGNQAVTWSEACSSYGRFCTRLKVALVLQAIALLCFLALALISAFRFFSKFAPPVHSKEGEEEAPSD